MQQRTWELIQEVVAVLTGIGTVLVGIGTIWATLRISGLEDYFRSEIAYRNEQLISSTEQLRATQGQQRRLQSDIARKKLDLIGLEKKTLEAEAALAHATGQRNQALSALDTNVRSQAIGQFAPNASVLNMTHLAFSRPVSAEQLQLGQQYLHVLQEALLKPENRQYRTYLLTAIREIPHVCPNLFGTKLQLPAAEGIPQRGEEFNPQKNERARQSMDKRNKVLIDGTDRFDRDGINCLCKALIKGTNGVCAL